MKWAVLSYLILNPFFYLIGYDTRDAQHLFYQLSSVILFALGMFFDNKPVKWIKLNISIGVLLIAFVLSWLHTQSGWYIASNLLFGILVYMTIVKTLTKEDIFFIFKGMCFLTVFCIIVLAFQCINWDFRSAQILGAKNSLIAGVKPESIFFQRSAMGMYFAHHIPILATINIFLAPILLIPMYWSQSMGAFLGAICGFSFLLWFRKRILFWIFLVFILGVGIFSLQSSSFKREAMTGINVRLSMWSVVTQDIFQQPLGHGLDSFANPVKGSKFYNYHNVDYHTMIKLVKDDNGVVDGATDKDNKLLRMVAEERGGSITYSDHPHNEYIWIGYEIGLVAWIILGFIFYFIWDRFKKSRRDMLTCSSMAILICLAVECFFQFPFHLARVGYILPLALGAFYIATEEE